MALDLLSNLLFSVLELIKGGFFFSIPAFVLAAAGGAVQKRLKNRFQLTWVISALAAAFIITLLVVIGVYYYPLIPVLGASPLGKVPVEFQDSFLEIVLQHLFNFARLVLVSAVLTLLVMPLAFVGSFVRNAIAQKSKWPAWITLYATVLLITILASGIILFIAPWIVAGILSLVFYGFQG